MPQQKLTVGQYFRSLNILHYALITGQALFAIIAFFLKTQGLFDSDAQFINTIQYVAGILALAGVISSSVIYRKQVNDIKSKGSLAEKLEAYRAIFIKRDALLEGPSLFSIIAYLLTGDLLFLALTGSLIAIFLYVRPNKERVIKNLDLSSDEIMIINDDNSVLK